MMNRIKAYFDSVAPGYIKKSEWKIWRWLRQKEAIAITDLIGSGSLGDVLELGCGTGYYTRRLSQQGCQCLVAVDFSPRMIEEYHIPGCVKKTADIQEFISEDKFDLILCAGALEFLQHPEAVFGNASKMLRAKGSFVVLIPRSSLFGRFYQLFHWFHQVPVRLFRLKEVEQWAIIAGLVLTKWQKVSLFSLAIKFSKVRDTG